MFPFCLVSNFHDVIGGWGSHIFLLTSIIPLFTLLFRLVLLLSSHRLNAIALSPLISTLAYTYHPELKQKSGNLLDILLVQFVEERNHAKISQLEKPLAT